MLPLDLIFPGRRLSNGCSLLRLSQGKFGHILNGSAIFCDDLLGMRLLFNANNTGNEGLLSRSSFAWTRLSKSYAAFLHANISFVPFPFPAPDDWSVLLISTRSFG